MTDASPSPTRALVATGAYGPAGFDPRWDIPKGAQVCDGTDGVRVAGAPVVITDIPAANGVIHVIDAVMLP